MPYPADKPLARDRRSWTDQQLVVAVRDAQSWRQVLGNLGLYPGGPNHVVKREAARLGLDITHFGAGPRFGDAELRASLATASSWTQVLTALRLRPGSRRCRYAVQARATSLGLSTDHLGGPRRRRRAALSLPGGLRPDRVHLREAAESLATAWFLFRGWWPAVPTEPRPYDLLLDTPGGVKRVQVKTTTCAAGSSWQVSISRHAGGGSRHDRRLAYTEAEVNLFLIIDGDLTLYLIPRAAVADRHAIRLGAYRGFEIGTAASMVSPRGTEADGRISPRFRPSTAPSSAPEPLSHESMRPVLKHLNRAAPSIAATWFLLRGVAVSAPLASEAYDMIAEMPEGLKLVQVKSTTYRDSRGSWVVTLGHRPDGPPEAADLVPYNADEVDLFFVVDGELLLYLMPFAEVAGKRRLSLSNYADFIVGDASSLLDSPKAPRSQESSPTAAA